MVKVAFRKAKNENWGKKLIALWTKGKYSHVELIIGDKQYSSHISDGGVRCKKHIYNEDLWDYVEVPNIRVKDILQFYSITKGDKYDLLGIAGFVIPFKDRTNEWFCSEWVSNALKISGYKKLWNQEPSKISPNKLYKILKDK
jgi:hypothetical protein